VSCFGNALTSKRSVATIGEQQRGLRVITPLTGANDSREYIAVIGYPSLLGPGEDTVTIEVGLREPLLTRAIRGEARTLLLDPIDGAPLVPPLAVPCLSREEAMAEKLRAALSRREPAIRDFYDVDHAIRRLGFRVQDPELVGLVREKLAVPGNEPVDISGERLSALSKQLEPQLRSVLREQDFAEFDLERAFKIVVHMAEAVR